MNLLEKLKTMSSKRALGEVVLVVQLMCVTTFAIYVLPPLMTYIKSLAAFHELYRDVDQEHAYFCNPSGALIANHDEKQEGRAEVLWQKTIQNMDYVEKVLKCGISSVFFENKQGDVCAAVLITYSKEAMEYFHLDLGENKGSISTAKGNRGMLQVTDSGDVIEAIYMGRDGTIQLTVGGEIENEAIPVISSHGTMASINSYVWFQPDMEDSIIMLTGENENLQEDYLWSPCYIVITDGTEDPVMFSGELENRLKDVGSVRTMKEEIDESKTQMLIDRGMFITRLAILFFLVFFGYGGYIYLQGKRKSRTYAVLELYGMSKQRLTVDIVGLNILIIAIGMVLGVLLHREILFLFTGYVYPTGEKVSFETVSLIFILYMITYAFWQIMGIVPILRETIIQRYKEER